MGVSKNSGFFPKSSILNRVFHYFHHPFWGFSPIFWISTQMKPFETFRGLNKLLHISLQTASRDRQADYGKPLTKDKKDLQFRGPKNGRPLNWFSHPHGSLENSPEIWGGK